MPKTNNITSIEEFKKYHCQKSNEYYKRCKENGKVELLLKSKRDRYANDEEFRKKMIEYNKQRYKEVKNKLLRLKELEIQIQ
jgi:hypothetical protein